MTARRRQIDAEFARVSRALAAFPSPDEVPAGWVPPAIAPLDPEHLATCTLSARLFAQRLNGAVYGYDHKANPTAIIGRYEFGHDFALIDGHILIDWWATEYGSGTDGHPGVLDLDIAAEAALIRRWYGDRARWERLGAR